MSIKKPVIAAYAVLAILLALAISINTVPSSNNNAPFLTHHPKSSVLGSRVVSIGKNILIKGTVYKVNSLGQKQPYTSAAVLFSYGLGFKDVIPANANDKALPVGEFMPFKEGSLINDKGTVYLITKSGKIGFSSAKAFLESNHSFSQVILADVSTMPLKEVINSIASTQQPDVMLNKKYESVLPQQASESTHSAGAQGGSIAVGGGGGGGGNVNVGGGGNFSEIKSKPSLAENASAPITPVAAAPVAAAPVVPSQVAAAPVVHQDIAPSAAAHQDSVPVTISATQVTAVPDSKISFVVSGTMTSSSALINSPVKFSVNVKGSGAPINDIVVDAEVYTSNNQKQNQQFFLHQDFSSNSNQTYSTEWTPISTGGYKLKIGIFNKDWTTTYLWNDNAVSFDVSAPQPALAVNIPAPVVPTPTSSGKLFGLNVSGAEFGGPNLPGILNKDYVYAGDASEYHYYSGKGLKLVRVPIKWERLQPNPLGTLSATDVAGVHAMLAAANASNLKVILDLHNYGKYYETAMVTNDSAKFADLWQKLAGEFKNDPGLYGYELMNEPHDLPGGSDSWAQLAQAGTDGVRKSDQNAWVLVPGYEWQSAARWVDVNTNLNVKDTSGKIIYAAHQYFDRDNSGTYVGSYEAEGGSPNIGTDRLQPFLNWLAQKNAKGMLTEYGIPDNDPRWLTVLDNFMNKLNNSPNIVGGTYWAAGPWWGTYPLSAEPRNGTDQPQMQILSKYK
ncbi:MAG: hypothetical protein NVSMB66_2650 [Candidatus Doudnabacteria bacterium]